MSNNVQILNFNHNVVEVAGDNKLVITDNTKNNSITIPQPVTNILQINSPGPQGPAGTGGGGNIDTGSLATTGSNTFRGNQTISGSIIFEGGSIVPNLYGAGGLDILAGENSYVELTSHNTQSFVWVDNYGAYIGTDWDAHARQWEFRDDGYFVLPQVQSLTKQAGILSAGDIIIQADESQSWRFSSGSGILQAPGGIEAPSFTGSLQGTADTASYYAETDPVFVAISSSLATTGSNTFTDSQNILNTDKNAEIYLNDVQISPAINLYNFQNFS